MTAHGLNVEAATCFMVPRGELYSSRVAPLPFCSLQNAGRKNTRPGVKIRVGLIHIVVWLFGFSNYSGELGKRAGSRSCFLICDLENSDRNADSITA